MRVMVSLLVGALFGAGLTVSGMTDTAKVQGWLDLLGDWDPTLAFVLGGAIVPMALAWILVRQRPGPVLGGSFPAPPDPAIDTPLIGGSTLFGIGWALVGLCPGPAMAILGYGGEPALIFFVAMAVGMVLARALSRATKHSGAPI